MGNNNSTDKQRFMELMQRCLSHEWKKYWDCLAKDFDLSMMLQEIENPRLHIQDRLLLSLLVEIRLGDVERDIDLTHAARTLDEGQRRLACRMDQ
jgi:hypothetical protein